MSDENGHLELSTSDGRVKYVCQNGEQCHVFPVFNSILQNGRQCITRQTVSPR